MTIWSFCSCSFSNRSLGCPWQTWLVWCLDSRNWFFSPFLFKTKVKTTMALSYSAVFCINASASLGTKNWKYFLFICQAIRSCSLSRLYFVHASWEPHSSFHSYVTITYSFIKKVHQSNVQRWTSWRAKQTNISLQSVIQEKNDSFSYLCSFTVGTEPALPHPPCNCRTLLFLCSGARVGCIKVML